MVIDLSGFIHQYFFLTMSSVQAAEKLPIKVGLLLPYTGVSALAGKVLNDGVELYFDEIGRKGGGRAIQLFKEDTEYNATVGLTKVRRLVEQHRVNFIIGPVSSAVALAIQDYVRKEKVIQINPVAFTRELTSPEKASGNIFRVCETTDQSNYPMGKWMYKNTPHRNMVLAGTDFAAGHHSLEAFKAGFEEAGGKVIKEVYSKVGTMDFAPFLTAIDIKGVDAVYTFFTGMDTVRFVQQYQEFGLKKRIPLFGYVTTVDDLYLQSIGDAALGVITVTNYVAALDNPRNYAFVKAYSAKYGEPPSRYTMFGYTAAIVIGTVAEALKGEVEDVPRVAAEIKRIAPRIETPSGHLAFDQYNQRITNVYVQKVEKRDGRLVNVIIDKIGNVAQEDVWKWWRK